MSDAIAAILAATRGHPAELRVASQPPGESTASATPDQFLLPGKINEILSDQGPPPWYPVLVLALPIARPIFWCDPDRTLYPPALVPLGVKMSQLHIVRCETKDLLWAACECLRCSGVGMVLAPLQKDLSRLEARRLQLAAEQGGAMGILMRPRHTAHTYAAATRWHISPIPGERLIQRWKIELLHGHGGRVGQTWVLERSYANFNAAVDDGIDASGPPHRLYPFTELVDHAGPAPAGGTGS